MKGFNIIALDKNYQIVSLLRFTNLQWNRKYHESGSFSMQIPLEQYSPHIKYIYTKDRPEMGKVTQINYIDKDRFRCVQLSGYFLEKTLDRHIVYQNGTSNIVNAPSWLYQSGSAEDVAYAYFNGFRTIKTSSAESFLQITPKSSQSRGKYSIHYRNGEYLGWKVYDILKPSGMSYRVAYDFIQNTNQFEVWSGIDRTEGNADRNNPIIFSTKYGNIKNPDILLDETNYKNACLIVNEQVNDEKSTYTARAVFSLDETDTEYSFLYEQSGLNKNDYTDAEFSAVLENEARNAISQHMKSMNVEFDAMEGSYEYMKDFDLGDLCSIEIPEMSLSVQARLIGCYEVMKSGKWSMTMEFGTPILLGK